MNTGAKGLLSQYDDAWLIDGVRAPAAVYNTVLGLVSPIDLGIKVAREILSPAPVFLRSQLVRLWPGTWRKPASMPTCCLATSAFTPEYPSKYPHIWCSVWAEPGSKPFCKRPIPSSWVRSS